MNSSACWRNNAAWREEEVSSPFSVPSFQFSVFSSQFSILNSQFSILNSQFSILNSDAGVGSSVSSPGLFDVQWRSLFGNLFKAGDILSIPLAACGGRGA